MPVGGAISVRVGVVRIGPSFIFGGIGHTVIVTVWAVFRVCAIGSGLKFLEVAEKVQKRVYRFNYEMKITQEKDSESIFVS